MKALEAMSQGEKKVPEVPANWDRCHAYMKQKSRFCRQRRQGSRSLYCGNHQHLEPTNHSQRKRIPCPVDPSHMIFEDQVGKHVPICPQTKKRKRQEAAEYFKENINAGGCGDLCDSSTSIPEKELSKWAQKIALRVLEVHQQIFQGKTECNSTQPEKLTFSDIHDAIEMKDFSQKEMDAGIVESFQSYRIKSGGSRHIPQLASLIGHLRAIDVLPSIDKTEREAVNKPLLLLEMGAGRGMLGLTAAGVACSDNNDTHLMMIERAGTRSKAEKIFRNLGTNHQKSSSFLTLDKVKWSRIKCDLSHVYLPVLLEKDELKDATVVVIAKHLCGVGTDLALKAIEPIKNRVAACVLATCCHGVCNWCDYVGRDFLHKKMKDDAKNITFGPTEFDLLRLWCAGAVACQDTTDKSKVDAPVDEEVIDDDQEAQADHTVPEVTEPARINISTVVSSLQLACGVPGLGRACQRLIDYGRTEYLRNDLFEGKKDHQSTVTGLYHYVTPQTTPQNAVLVAYRK
jgi:tRNA:m4X modification enzyme